MKLDSFLRVGVAVTALCASFAGHGAPTFPTFTVQPGAGLQGSIAPFVANDIGGQYSETFTFGSNTFSSSILFTGNIFSLDDSNGNVTYQAFQTGLGARYGVYVIETAQGTYTTDSAGVTNFQVTSGQLSFYLDPYANSGQVTSFSQPPDGSTPYGRAGFADDVLLFTGNLIPAGSSGTQNCTGGNNCGSFGQVSSVVMTAAGSAFFISPVPFYNMSLTSGQFTGVPITPGTVQRQTGTANAVFVNAVPEPSALALVGVALVALGYTQRRRNQG